MTTTSDFWKKGVSVDNVYGGPARILVAKRSTTAYPEVISDVLDLSTYDPAGTWQDIGHTSTPFASTSGFDTTEWVSQQAGIINTQVGNWNRAITVSMMESRNNLVMDVVHEQDGRTSNSDGDQVEYFWDQPDTTEWRVVAMNLQENKTAGQNIIMDVFPNCKRSGADSEMSWDRDNPQANSVELKPFPDEGVPLTSNWYRITQT